MGLGGAATVGLTSGIAGHEYHNNKNINIERSRVNM